MRYADKVDVKIAGVRVGSAMVRSNGTIDIHMAGPNPLGQEILDLIEAGTITGLSITPITDPTEATVPNYLKLRSRGAGPSTV